MHFIIILILLLLPKVSFSSMSHLSCSKNGTYIVFINGINVSDKGYLSYFINQNNILNLVREKAYNVDSKSLVDGNVFRNTSEGQTKDVAETFLLWLESQTYDDNKKAKYLGQFVRYITQNNLFYDLCSQNSETKDVCDKILEIDLTKPSSTNTDLRAIKAAVAKKLNEGNKIIFVTHSAGSSYSDNVRDYIETYFPVEHESTGHLAIAPSLTSRHPNYYYMTFRTDELVNKIRTITSKFFLTTPDGNYDLLSYCPLGGKRIDFPAGNHDIPCYFGSRQARGSVLLLNQQTNEAKDMIVDSIFRIASKLPNNDENCCNKAPGKIWRNDSYCESNPELCQTSFISDSTKFLVNNASFVHDTQICGDYTIRSNNPASFSKTKMYGSGYIIAEPDDEMQFGSTTLHKKSIFEAKVKTLGSFNTEFDGTSRLYGNAITFIDSKIKGFNRFESTGITSISLRNTQLNSESLELNKIETSTPLIGGRSGISLSDSTLTGKFDLAFNGDIARSILNGNTELNGSAVIVDSTSSGTLKMNTDGGGNSSPLFLYAINQGNLTITNSVQASNATFHGTNRFYAEPTTNSTVQSLINTADVQDTNLSGHYNVTSGSRRWIKNLIIHNHGSVERLGFGINTWSGTLTLNGSMTVDSSSFGRDVTINAITPGPNEYRLGILRSTFSDELVVSEKGIHVDCNFTGSGSSYTRSCPVGLNNLKVNPLFAIDQQAERAKIQRVIRIEKEKVNKRIAELKAIHKIKLK